MNASSANVAQSSLLLWALAALVAFMSASVCHGWLRQARLKRGLAHNLGAVTIASLVLGLGICSSVVLAMSAEALPFPMGYRMAYAPLLLLGAVLGCWPAMALLGNRRAWFASAAAGLIVGSVALLVQWGWIEAAGFRPGVTVSTSALAMAGLFMVLITAVALGWAMVEAIKPGQRKLMARNGSALAMGMAFLVGQQILLSGTNLPAQVGSVFRTEVPASILCLVLGVLVPLGLLILMLDLNWRRRQQRRQMRREARRRPRRLGYILEDDIEATTLSMNSTTDSISGETAKGTS